MIVKPPLPPQPRAPPWLPDGSAKGLVAVSYWGLVAMVSPTLTLTGTTSAN